MTDPAIEAVQRAWGSTVTVGAGGNVINPWQVAVFATREALKPIRELHKTMTGERPGIVTDSDFAKGMDFVLEELAPLIYATEENDNE